MLSHKKFIESAQCVFGCTEYQASEEDINDLAGNMELLESGGLGDLYQRLIKARGHDAVFATIAEHNFAAMLSRHLGELVPIEYEPPDYGSRPVDFRFQMNENTYCLQMKRFADLKIWNRQHKMLRDIARETEKIKIQLFFGCELAEDFQEEDIPQFLDFLSEHAPNSQEGVQYDYLTSAGAKAKVAFYDPQGTILKGLTLRFLSDILDVEVKGDEKNAGDMTGQASMQIRCSIRKSSGAFIHSIGESHINLVIAEADKYKDIDIAEACFGTEQNVFRGRQHSWERQGNGIFAEPEIIDKVVGLITLRRIDKSKPISAYTMLLYINEKHLNRLSAIETVFPIKQVIHRSMRPGDTGNF